MTDLDTRIRDALRAAAAEVREDDLRPADPPRSSPVIHERRPIRWVPPILAAAAVVAVVATSVALSGSPRPTHRVAPAGTASSARSSAPGQTPPTKPPKPPSAASTTVEAKSSAASAAPACFFADACPTTAETYYEPLWPFRNYGEARHWESIDGPQGHSPWHLDARQTALSFTAGFLGFTDVTMVTKSEVQADQAHVGVGFRDTNGGTHTAAVLHLVRYERLLGDSNAGWEVVGSDDTTLSVEKPAYGSTVASPMTVGGHITGVDENIRVAVRTFDQVVGRAAPIPAGGTDTPWSVRVDFTGSGVLTIVASTGGHLVQHERLAIQGVRTAT